MLKQLTFSTWVMDEWVSEGMRRLGGGSLVVWGRGGRGKVRHLVKFSHMPGDNLVQVILQVLDNV